ncbi:putative bifunctional diguanylate cyclase/phosphodiesterase, partial [Azospirillum isscasi]
MGGAAVGIRRAIGGGRLAAPLGGAIAGAAATAMHFTGMAALQVPANLHYDTGYAVAALASGVLLGGAGFTAALRTGSLKGLATGAVLLALGICGLHFTGMAGVTLIPDPLHDMSDQIMAPGLLAVAIAVAATVVMALGLAGAIVDQRLADRAAHEAARLRASEERFRQLADATTEGIVIHRGGVILDVNRAMAELLGEPPGRFIGQSMLRFVAPNRRAEVETRLAEPTSNRVEVDLLHADGTPVMVEAHGQDITHEGRPARVVAVRDIRERKRAEERIRHMANHDLLTGLPNRSLFLDRLNVALASVERTGAERTGVAVHYLDLDRFKAVNDLLGHPAGDRLLQEMARRLLDAVSGHDTVARLSGDEFAILQRIAQPGEALALADRLVKALGAPADLDGQRMTVGASIGIALFPQDGAEAEPLLQHADTALYRAKSEGRGTFRFFEAAMDERLQARRGLERDLRQALADGALCVHYQPLEDCRTRRILGFEALVRWKHPVRGMIPPSEFVPLAEESGLVMQLGEFVLRTACRDARTWPAPVKVAVNLSPIQFRHSDLPATVLAILEEEGLAPHRLEIEVTEGVMIDDTERALAALSALKAAGVRIALDDFGTGYSSLSYLQKFTFDKLKIDRSFVQLMAESRESLSIIRTILALAKSLDIAVTAEGVETEEQRTLLKNESCNQLQGYLIGRPVPASELARFYEPA